MPLITVPEYAKHRGVSVQAIYQQIKRGSLSVTMEDGIKYIQVDAKRKSKPKCSQYKREIKYLRKQIKRITKDKDKQYHQLEKLFDKLLQLNVAPVLSEVIDVKPMKKKKK